MSVHARPNTLLHMGIGYLSLKKGKKQRCVGQSSGVLSTFALICILPIPCRKNFLNRRLRRELYVLVL